MSPIAKALEFASAAQTVLSWALMNENSEMVGAHLEIARANLTAAMNVLPAPSPEAH